MTTPLQLQKLYREGQNICDHLRSEYGVEKNTPEIIEIAYDLQSGSYIDAMRDPEMAAHKAEYSAMIAEVIRNGMVRPQSILEAGVGEATTLSGVLSNLRDDSDSAPRAYGFDLSWSRLRLAKNWLAKEGLSDMHLCTGDLCEIPFADESIDVVYTSHSIEPNGGREIEILQELYRVAARRLVLVEPGYEFACEEGQQRMRHHGYCRDLAKHAERLGWEVTDHRPLGIAANPLNPSAVTVIEKSRSLKKLQSSDDPFACPVTRRPLKRQAGVYFSPENLSVYPIVEGIGCLRRGNAIMASAFGAA